MCDAVYTTTQAIDYSRGLLVRGLLGKQLLPFSRDVLLISLHKSLGHRPHALDDASGLCATIMAKLAPQATDGVLTTEQIIRVTSVALTRFDKLAAQHYQAFHRLT
jgi:transcriptional regulator NrdR family protein